MECLVGYIGFSSKRDAQTAPSGLYVDALPDISYAQIEKLTDDDETAQSLWSEIESRAIFKFRTLFVREVNKWHKLNDISKCECLICQNKELLATALWYLMGAEVMYTRATSSRMNSYTSLDRTKAKEIRSEFESRFADELETSVRGLDVHSSTCFDNPAEQPPERDITELAYSVL